ncbi:MAG: hypothetical protein RL538_324 [Candidatus Parcubacteria bacterium]
MDERKDVFFDDGTYCKYKPMPSGEIRTSMASVDGTKISITKAPKWEIGEALPWQPAHFHKGLIESYQLVSGWMRMVWIQGCVCQTYLSDPGQTKVLPAGSPHVVLLGPGAEIITTSFGVPVPNPDKKGNDWWDADGYFYDQISNEFGFVEEVVLRMA